jgi:hypothetical protein
LSVTIAGSLNLWILLKNDPVAAQLKFSGKQPLSVIHQEQQNTTRQAKKSDLVLICSKIHGDCNVDAVSPHNPG